MAIDLLVPLDSRLHSSTSSPKASTPKYLGVGGPQSGGPETKVSFLSVLSCSVFLEWKVHLLHHRVESTTGSVDRDLSVTAPVMTKFYARPPYINYK